LTALPYAVKSGNEEVFALLLQAERDRVSDLPPLISLVYCYGYYVCTIITHVYMSALPLQVVKANAPSEVAGRVLPKRPIQETRKDIEVKETMAVGTSTVTDLESLLPKTIDLDRYKKVRESFATGGGICHFYYSGL
jgi:hypothetical protein